MHWTKKKKDGEKNMQVLKVPRVFPPAYSYENGCLIFYMLHAIRLVMVFGKSMQLRDHKRPYRIDEANRALKKIAKSIETTVGRKVGRLPGGAFCAYVQCFVRDRRGILHTAYKIVGDAKFADALKSLRTVAPGDGSEKAEYYLSMPNSTEQRASKLRKILREEWSFHAHGTPWEKSRQIFRAVKEGAPCFPWWSSVTEGAPFESSSLDDPDISRRVYEYVAPRLLQKLENQMTA